MIIINNLESKNIIQSFLAANNNRTYNLPLSKALSPECGMIYPNLIYLDTLFTESKKDGYFYTTYNLIYENTGLSEERARTALKRLKNLGLIEMVKKGIPAKNYFKVNYDLNLLNKILNAGFKEEGNYEDKETQDKVLQSKVIPAASNGDSRGQANGNPVVSNKEYNKNKIINNKRAETSPNKQSTLIDKPIIEKETIVEDVIDYFNEVLNKRTSSKGKENTRLIMKIFKTGRTFEDFKYVIDVKKAEWENVEDMKQYLRPETLFGNKFEMYLAQPMKGNVVCGIDMNYKKELESKMKHVNNLNTKETF